MESNASNSSTLDSNDADLVWQMLPGMVDNDNQPLPENIPTPADEGRSQHNSLPTGSILGVASTASKVEGRTRHA